MWVAIYWIIKISAWGGFVFSAFSVFNPDLMLKFMVKAAAWKLKLFALEAQIRPLPNAPTVMRAWSAVMAVVFAAIIYTLTYIVTLGYVLK